MSLLDHLSAAWAFSDTFFQSLRPKHHLSTPIALRNPFIFYFGHLAAFEFNTVRRVLPLHNVNKQFEDMFSRGRDPDTDDPSVCHDHPPPPPVWPSWHQVVQFRDDVRAVVKHNIQAGKLNGAVVRLLVEHQTMHVETLYYMLAQMNHHPAPIPSQQSSKSPPHVEWVTVPAGNAIIGRERPADDYHTFGWDNEFHPGVVLLPEFQIMRNAVTIASFKSFVDAGGYTNKHLWNPDDWDWIKRESMEYPATWRMIHGVLHVLTNVGPPEPPSTAKETTHVAEWPVSVSLAEARAYARWIGAHVPTEEQWMRAAGHDDATWAPKLASAPAPVHQGPISWCGAVGMVGNGWELTTSVFDTFEGFLRTELYPEYSQDFFDGKHYVVKGASWVTHPAGVRPSFRNFYQARYPYVFSKFRLVRSR